MKKIGIIGIGGRTGTMFAFELKKTGQVFGIGKEREISLIKEKKLFVERNEKNFLFEGELIEEKDFPKEIDFDFLFLTVKNPVNEAVKYYYQKIKEKKLKPPALFLSQNGIEAGEGTISVLKEIFGQNFEEIPVFRISLFNPIDRKIFNDKISIVYSLPIKLAISKISGPNNFNQVLEIFKKAKFEFQVFQEKEWKNMEYSKLFLNLIGMASATFNLSVKEGFSKKEVFFEEILAIKEYIKVIKKAGGNFLNFKNYPVKFFSFIFSLPNSFLLPLRKIFANLAEKERKGKPKDLDEIEYYNGAVVKLGERFGIETPINKKILERAKSCLSKE
jgi:2-dehydropantoate 2-reductase